MLREAQQMDVVTVLANLLLVGLFLLISLAFDLIWSVLHSTI